MFHCRVIFYGRVSLAGLKVKLDALSSDAFSSCSKQSTFNFVRFIGETKNGRKC